VLCLSLVTSNTAGTTKKAFSSVSVAVAYAVGNIVGPQFFRASQAPEYKLGIFAMMVCFAGESAGRLRARSAQRDRTDPAVMCASGGVYWLLVLAENKRRDRLYGKPVIGREELVQAVLEQGATDGTNKDFRYSY